MDGTLTDDVALELLQKWHFGVDLETKTELAQNQDYWLSLCPEMHIRGDGAADRNAWEPEKELRSEVIEAAIRSYQEGGYFQLTDALSHSQLLQMRAVIEKLRVERWPAVFAFVYDAFWFIPQARSIRALLERLIGVRYYLRSGVWSHYVEPTGGSAGWAPHTDGNFQSPFAISVWVPVSQATLDNGCMHVIKRDRQTDENSRDFSRLKCFVKEDVRSLFRNVRALPAAPGTVLGWDQHLIHWGGAFVRGNEPRISLALEFSTSDGQGHTSATLIDPAHIPSFAERSQMIARAILKYRRFEKAVDQFAPVAEAILASSP